jgi:large subunit ribosomal protein L3
MAIGLVGRKAGMTRVFTDAGETVPVTVIEVLPNRVTQVKAQDKDGYRAVQVTYGTRRPQLYSKAVAGHYGKANVAPGRALVEFRLPDADKTEWKAGSEIKADLFKEGEAVDVTGTTIGKGFAGPMKRWNFAGLRATHGVSISHRSHGSTGGRQDPGKTFKNKKMAGHMGVERVTTLNLKVVQTDVERGLVLVEGAVPGNNGGWITVRDAVKKPLPKDLPKPGKFRLADAAPAGEAKEGA